jgi:hypothetical protein
MNTRHFITDSRDDKIIGYTDNGYAAALTIAEAGTKITGEVRHIRTMPRDTDTTTYSFRHRMHSNYSTLIFTTTVGLYHTV